MGLTDIIDLNTQYIGSVPAAELPLKELKRIKKDREDTKLFADTFDIWEQRGLTNRGLDKPSEEYIDSLTKNFYLAKNGVFVTYPAPGKTFDKALPDVAYPFNVDPKSSLAMLVVLDEIGKSRTRFPTYLPELEVQSDSFKLASAALNYFSIYHSNSDPRGQKEAALADFLKKYVQAKRSINTKDPANINNAVAMLAFSAAYHLIPTAMRAGIQEFAEPAPNQANVTDFKDLASGKEKANHVTSSSLVDLAPGEFFAYIRPRNPEIVPDRQLKIAF